MRAPSKPAIRPAALALALFLSVSAYAEQGFYHPNDKRVPTAVRDATDSVFRIVTLRARPLVIDASQYANVLKSKTEPPSFPNRLVQQEVRDCMSRNAPACPLYYDTAGSAFLAGAPSILWTAAHVVSHQTKASTPPPTSPPRFRLFDSRDKLIFDSWHCSSTFLYFGTVPKNRSFPARFYMGLTRGWDALKMHNISQARDDYAVVDLGCELHGINPLSLETSSLEIGERVFAAGYPSSISEQDLDPNCLDSANPSLWITSGPAISVFQTIPRRPVFDDIEETQAMKDLDDEVLIFDSFATTGMSGSPVLNESGNVVGLVSATSRYSKNLTINPRLQHTSIPLHDQ